MCFPLVPSSVACRSWLSCFCVQEPRGSGTLICHVTSRFMIYLRKDLFTSISVPHSSAEHHLTTSFNLFLTVCYWASSADIDVLFF